VESTKRSQKILDGTAYAELLKPTQNNAPVSFSAYDNVLYDKVLMKYGDHAHDVSETAHHH
jgi:hypothetical protein